MNERIKDIVNTLLFSLLFISVLVVNIVSSDQELSFSERRKLRQFPEITWTSILNNKAMEDFDKYVLDQFVGRDSFRRIKSQTELFLLFKKDNNNLFIENGHIFKKLYPLNKEAVAYAADRFNYLYDQYLQGKNVYYTVIPDKSYYLDEKLGYLNIDYDDLLEILKGKLNRMRYIDIFDTLDLNCFYRTDLHWRQELLTTTLNKIAASMGFSLFDDYQEYQISGFKGAYHGQLALKTPIETLIYLSNDSLDKLLVYNFEMTSYSLVYDLNKKSNIDQYDIFLSGPTAILIIENPEAKTNKELIVFRDSFGSSIVPLMLQDYRKTTIIDIRYVNSDYLGQVVDFSAQDILFIYSANILNSGTVLK